MSTTTQVIKLELIRTDGGTQSRAALNPETVQEYADRMTEGDQFPPVITFFDGEVYWLADGFHRVEACRMIEKRRLVSDVRQGTRRDAVLFSVGANATHGLRRTNADKRRAVETLLRDEEWAAWSDREIARKCGVHHELVGKVRLELSGGNRQINPARKVERNGTVYTQNTQNIGRQVEQEKPSGEFPQTEPAPRAIIDLSDTYGPLIPQVEVLTPAAPSAPLVPSVEAEGEEEKWNDITDVDLYPGVGPEYVPLAPNPNDLNSPENLAADKAAKKFGNDISAALKALSLVVQTYDAADLAEAERNKFGQMYMVTAQLKLLKDLCNQTLELLSDRHQTIESRTVEATVVN